MKLGILQCDDIIPELIDRYPSYPTMFKTLFQRIEPQLNYEVFAVHKGNLPASPNRCDAYLITGSQFSAYENLKWIAPLEDFIRTLNKEKRKLIGICFGHQLIAQALGGTAVKSEKGWGVGLSINTINSHEPWMQPFQETLRLLVSHQDQVTDLPENVRVIGSSDFCPYYLLQYGDHILSIQGHPEFTSDYTATLIEKRRGRLIPEERAKTALSSLKDKNDSQLMAQWIINFIKL